MDSKEAAKDLVNRWVEDNKLNPTYRDIQDVVADIEMLLYGLSDKAKI